MICMLFAASVVRADDWDLAEEDVYGEARLLDSVFNNTSIDLNSILALILIGVLALITLGPNFLGGGSGSGYGQRNSYYNNAYDYQDGYYNENQFYQRAGKVDDVATKLAQLDSALKKYQVEEAECEMFIACEASQVHRLEENGPLAKIVNEIFSTMNPEKNYPKMTDRMANLFQSFQYGTNAYQSGQYDACQPLRNKCFELHARTN